MPPLAISLPSTENATVSTLPLWRILLRALPRPFNSCSRVGSLEGRPASWSAAGVGSGGRAGTAKRRTLTSSPTASKNSERASAVPSASAACKTSAGTPLLRRQDATGSERPALTKVSSLMGVSMCPVAGGSNAMALTCVTGMGAALFAYEPAMMGLVKGLEGEHECTHVEA